MASEKEDHNGEDWEDVIMMLELPNGANLNATKKDLYLQVAGLCDNKPVVKLDNMLYEGKVSESLGSHLFIECKEGNGAKQARKEKEDEPLTLVSNTYIKLEPIYLERKSDVSQHPSSGQSSVTEER